MSFYREVSPERGTHIIDNRRSEMVGLSATGKAKITIDYLLDMFQRCQVRQGIGSHAVQYLTESVALLRHPRYGAVAQI